MQEAIIDSSSLNSLYMLSNILYEEICPIIKLSIPLVVLCIGTDRATGDCLGPLVGDKLKFINNKNIYIYGTLEKPVHAKNICDFIDKIQRNFSNPYIIAVDACLGSVQNIGKVIVNEKPVSPGAALNKSLPRVGNLSITGVVNISGALEFMVLQNTRLFTVMGLADLISRSIYHAFIRSIKDINDFHSMGNLNLQ